MNRSGYTDDFDMDPLVIGRWRGQVAATIRGRRGQAFLRELAAAMDAMRHRWLICDELIDEEGDCCAIGAVCKARGLDTAGMDDEDGMECVAERLGVPWPLASEIVNENDGYRETPERRWQRMRKWVDRHITQGNGQ